MILTRESLVWGVACGSGSALYAALISEPLVAIIMFLPGFLIGAWAEQTRYPR
jgi:hypothetical protein